MRLASYLKPHLCEHQRSAQRSFLTGRSDRRPRSVSGGEKDDAGLRLYHAALAGDLVAMAAALAQGAEVNGSIGEEEGRTALIGAAVGVREHTERRGDSGNPVITKRNNQLRAARKKNLVFYVCK